MRVSIDTIDRTVNKYRMIDEGDTVVVGVSGGADSMLLLHYFLHIRDKYDLKLIVAHVEHGIRGQASKDDCAFVEALCREHHLDFRFIEVNAPRKAKEHGMGLEEYCRKVRYDFFASLPCDKIALAHNRTDHVETILLHLTRGCSVKGARGIVPVRGNIIRPLIECSSSDIRAYCQENRISYVTDATNEDTSFARNYIRHELLPRFETLNPSFEEAMVRFAQHATLDDDALTQEAEQYLAPELSVQTLKKLPEAVAKRTILLHARKYGITLDDFHVSAVYQLLFKSGKYQLKGSNFAISNNSVLRIADLKKSEPGDLLSTEKIITTEEYQGQKVFYQKEFAFCCDYDKIVGNVCVRHRQSGDKIAPAGRGCTKSLKKLFNELAIPLEQRESIPVICDDEKIIGIYGYCVAQEVAADAHTKRVYLLNIMEDKNQ